MLPPGNVNDMEGRVISLLFLFQVRLEIFLPSPKRGIQFVARRQGSSAVEQGTHKPLVGSSILPSGTFFMAWVYILSGTTGRHYIGSTVDLEARFAQHLRGHTATTKRLGGQLTILAKKEVASLAEARTIERVLKQKKNPRLAIYYLQR